MTAPAFVAGQMVRIVDAPLCLGNGRRAFVVSVAQLHGAYAYTVAIAVNASCTTYLDFQEGNLQAMEAPPPFWRKGDASEYRSETDAILGGAPKSANALLTSIDAFISDALARSKAPDPRIAIAQALACAWISAIANSAPTFEMANERCIELAAIGANELIERLK